MFIIYEFKIILNFFSNFGVLYNFFQLGYFWKVSSDVFYGGCFRSLDVFKLFKYVE
jgi:hypothetical protein